MNHTEYIELLESFAREHKEIAHTPGGRRSSFVTVTLSAEPFPELYLDKLLEGMGTRLKDIFLVAETPHISYQRSGSARIREVEGAFIVFARIPSRSSEQQQTQGFATAERIAEEVLARMQHDLERAETMRYHTMRLGDCQGDKIGPYNETYCGHRISFIITATAPNLKFNPSLWQ